MVLDPMESRYFAGPAAIIMVELGNIRERKADAYMACSTHCCLWHNAYPSKDCIERGKSL